MGIFTTVGRWFGSSSKHQARINLSPQPAPKGEAPAPRTNAAAAGTATTRFPSQSERPVRVDLHADDDPDLDLEGFDPTPRNGTEAAVEVKKPKSRQELIGELQKNYQEVLGIVRKVDTHLDEQGQRSRRMADIAERMPAAADDIAQIRAQHDAMHAALESVALSLRRRDDALTEGQRATLERLEEIRGLMAESGEAERQLIGSLVEFRDAMGGMTTATERLTEAVERIESREQRRVEDILGAIRSTKSSVAAVGIIAAGAAVIALALGFVAIVF